MHASTAENVFSGDYNDLSNQPNIPSISTFNTITRSNNETAIGTMNTDYTPETSTSQWNSGNRLFVICNGNPYQAPPFRRDALIILKKGTITAPSLSIAEIDAAGSKALITREYLNANTVNSLNGLNDVKVDGDGRSIFIGRNAGELDDGTNNDNVAMGFKALSSNVSGLGNVAIGFETLLSNTTGNFNTAIGFESLRSNDDGTRNTASGHGALSKNIGRSYNTANGYHALNNNTSGNNNTSMGYFALNDNTTGIQNTANGNEALRLNTNGYNNTASGYQALDQNTTGHNNTAIGYDAQVTGSKASNQVRIGNTAITYAGIQVDWSITSDQRWKDNIRNLPYGLDMVMQLKPVDYTRKNNDKKTREMGFVAQDLEALLAKVGYTDQGLLTEDDNGYLSVRYNDLIALLTKALQEQQAIIEEQKAKDVVQDKSIEALVTRLNLIESKSSN